MGIFALPSASMAVSLFLVSICAAAKATETALAHRAEPKVRVSDPQGHASEPKGRVSK